jgi:hypothetical protein
MVIGDKCVDKRLHIKLRRGNVETMNNCRSKHTYRLQLNSRVVYTSQVAATDKTEDV